MCSDRRFVELQEIAKNLKCCLCSKVLLLEKITHEKRLGLNSVLNVECEDCNVITLVPTGKIHLTKSEVKHSDVNTKLVLGKLIQNF